jgi:hypothetical protein
VTTRSGVTRNSRLYFAEVKFLRSSFGKIHEGVVAFLEQLCRPASSRPVAVMISSGPPQGSSSFSHQVHEYDDGTEQSRERVQQLYDQALRVWHLPDHTVYVKWQPDVGIPPTDFSSFWESRQLALAQDSKTDTTWAFVYLLTNFSQLDADFLDFYQRANALLPFKLQPSRWRHAIVTRTGGTVLRKVTWPVGQNKLND